MNTPLVGRTKIALMRAKLSVCKTIAADGCLSLVLFNGDDDRLFVSATFGSTDVIVLIKSGPDCISSEVSKTKNAACAAAWMRTALESLPQSRFMKTLRDGELLERMKACLSGSHTPDRQQ